MSGRRPVSTWANSEMADGTPMPVETVFHETGLRFQERDPLAMDVSMLDAGADVHSTALPRVVLRRDDVDEPRRARDHADRLPAVQRGLDLVGRQRERRRRRPRRCRPGPRSCPAPSSRPGRPSSRARPPPARRRRPATAVVDRALAADPLPQLLGDVRRDGGQGVQQDVDALAQLARPAAALAADASVRCSVIISEIAVLNAKRSKRSLIAASDAMDRLPQLARRRSAPRRRAARRRCPSPAARRAPGSGTRRRRRRRPLPASRSRPRGGR